MEDKNFIRTLDTLKIVGGRAMSGEIRVDASKNAFLPILAATLLCEDEVTFNNYVNLSDLHNMCGILQEFDVTCTHSGKNLAVNAKNAKNARVKSEMSRTLRASIILLGAMLARFRSAVIAYPGGCKIGARPIDIHINAFKSLGAKIVERHGYIYAHGEDLHAGEVVFPFPSVGATESLMMCACKLNGETVLKNVAKEPEIVELQKFLNCCGAKVSGAGSDQIRIEGVKRLHGTAFHVMSDRIVAGTYLVAAATLGGKIVLKEAVAEHNESLISFLRQSACKISVKDDIIELTSSKRPVSIDKIETMPYPYFPTDLQPMMMVLQSVSDGVSMIFENVFENRFTVVEELRKMGANINIRDRVACVVGVDKLFGAEVFASDLRAGASLVIAGAKAEGYTCVHNICHIDRGYEKIEEKLSSLGLDVSRLP